MHIAQERERRTPVETHENTTSRFGFGCPSVEHILEIIMKTFLLSATTPIAKHFVVVYEYDSK